MTQISQIKKQSKHHDRMRVLDSMICVSTSIFDTLRKAADSAKAAPMAAYMRGQFPFLGIQMPERKKLCRAFLNEVSVSAVDWGFVRKCWALPEREFQYLGVAYLRKAKDALTPADIPSLRKIITAKSWWDTVDGLDVLVGEIALRHPETNAVLLAWSVDENIWLRRVAINHQRDRKSQTDTALLEKIIVNCFSTQEFFINKAIGWALREYSKTNPAWVRNFIKRHKAQMAPLSSREAGKYV